MDELLKRMANLEGDFKVVRSDVGNLVKRLDEAQAETRSHRENLTRILSDLAVLVKDRKDMNEDVRVMRDKIDALEKGQAKLYTICAVLATAAGAGAGKIASLLGG